MTTASRKKLELESLNKASHRLEQVRHRSGQNSDMESCESKVMGVIFDET